MRNLTTAALVGSALVAGSLGTAAAVSSGGSSVHVCAGKHGALRLAGKCAKTERGLTLGEQGPQGIQGPAGQQGVAGPQGKPGASDYYIANVEQNVTDPGTYTVTARCVGYTGPVPDGTVLGGGGSGGVITGEVPTPLSSDGQVPASYAVTFQVTAPTTLSAYAICAWVS